jgi:hypothetical protein
MSLTVLSLPLSARVPRPNALAYFASLEGEKKVFNIWMKVQRRKPTLSRKNNI